MATIRDVAEYCGLSVATISKFLNGGRVKDRNRAQIQEAIRVLGYQVNPYARSLKTRKSMSIGVLLPSTLTPFFRNMLTEADSVLRSHGYSSLAAFYTADHGIEREKLRSLINAGVDGLIYAPERITAQEFEELTIGRSIPVIFVDRIVAGIQADAVLTDCGDAIRQGMEALISANHRHIAIINGPETVYTARERMAGYLQALSGRGILYDPALVKSGEYEFSTGYRCFQELMRLPQPPTAVFATNYDLTLGAITAAHEKGLKIPGDIAFFGFDCYDICSILEPPIPVVHQPEQQLGQQAVLCLLERLKGFNGDCRTIRLSATADFL